jgi:hypothetical protein
VECCRTTMLRKNNLGDADHINERESSTQSSNVVVRRRSQRCAATTRPTTSGNFALLPATHSQIKLGRHNCYFPKRAARRFCASLIYQTLP